MDCYEKYRLWLESPETGDELRRELNSIENDDREIKLRFSSDITFGTAGLRGVIGAGSSYMNTVTVGWISQGIADYIKAEGAEDAGVVIGRDSRNNSSLFSEYAAGVFADNGIRVYFFEDICPTPQVSYAVKYFGAAMGINITASHNPKKYNGYKVYGSDGAQIGPDEAEKILGYAGNNLLRHVNPVPFSDLKNNGRFSFIDGILHDPYIKEVSASVGEIKPYNGNLKIVYTPLHGSGYRLVPEILSKYGFDVTPVTEQMNPDGEFTGCEPPNPEVAGSYEKALEYAQKNSADIILATDPDADRLGALVRSEGKYIPFTGNQIGAVLCRYRIENADPSKGQPFVVKSIVSTDLAKEICRKNGIPVYDVLTGFKYIGEQIKLREKDGNYFLFGFEESYGYLGASYSRDKDAVFSACAFAVLAAFCKSRKMTVCDYLEEIYRKYGYYYEKTTGIDLDPLNGRKNLTERLSVIRNSVPAEIAGARVSEFRDYLGGIAGLPSSDVLEFLLEDGSKLIIRPSGTEPKVKIYAMTRGTSMEDAEKKALYITSFAKEMLF